MTRRVFVCSPLRAPDSDARDRNYLRARRLCHQAMQAHPDVAPFAPHGFYPGFLDDTHSADRERGIAAGLAYLAVADELWVYGKRGITEGMRAEIERASALGMPIHFNPDCWRDVP